METKEQISSILSFLKDYDNIEILNDGSDGIIKIKFEWNDGFDEWTTEIVTLNLNNYTLKRVEDGYSCDHGGYNRETTMPFVDFHDLFVNFKKGIREFYD